MKRIWWTIPLVLAVSACSSSRPQAVLLVHTTDSRTPYVAGAGDTCDEAMADAELPAQWRDIECRTNEDLGS